MYAESHVTFSTLHVIVCTLVHVYNYMDLYFCVRNNFRQGYSMELIIKSIEIVPAISAKV